MHAVQRSSEPDFFNELRAKYTSYGELEGIDRQRIRNALTQDFGTICGYCERSCGPVTPAHKGDSEETTDHFRPIHHFPDLSLDWENMVFTCRRCNRAKLNKWPGINDGFISGILASEDPRYTPPTEYVNPSALSSARPAQDYFDFVPNSGEIKPAEDLDDVAWSMARRNISDIDLNDSHIAQNEQRHLWNLRLNQRTLLIQRLSELTDFDIRVNIMFEFMLPDKPFSSFITAYVKDRFPLMLQFFR